jgi:hypothetical protein
MKKQKKTRQIQQNKNGRPFAINEDMEKEISRLLSDGMSQAKVALAMGINEKTIIGHRRRFPEFSERIERAKMETDRLAHKSIKVGMLKDWRAGAWWLERRHPDEFRERKWVEIEKPSLIQDMFPLDDDS